jgi:IS5 family transposase
MRPRERQETGEQDLFRSRLDQIIDLSHALVKLSRAIDWRFLEPQCGSVYSDGPGCPPLPTRLMAGLALLKHMYDLSDEALCDRWIENPYFQFFCGEEFFEHRLAIQSLVADTGAATDGPGKAHGAHPGELGSGHAD